LLKSEGNSDSTLLLRPKELWKAFLINIKNRKIKRTDARYRRAQEKSSLPALLSHILIAVMGVTHCPDWSKVDDRNCGTYSFALDNALAEINIPAVLLGNRVADNLGHSLIESYYNDVLDPRAVAVSRYGWLTTSYGWLAGYRLRLTPEIG